MLSVLIVYISLKSRLIVTHIQKTFPVNAKDTRLLEEFQKEWILKRKHPPGFCQPSEGENAVIIFLAVRTPSPASSQ